MGASQTVSLTEFPYYFVKLQLSVYVPIDNVLGGLIAEDFHLDTLAAECKCSGVSLQVCARAGSFFPRIPTTVQYNYCLCWARPHPVA